MKKVSVILIVIAIVLTGISVYMFFVNNSKFDKKEENFYKAIDSLKEGQYAEAYNFAEGLSDNEDKRTIKNIISYSYFYNAYNCINDMTEVSKKTDEIVSTASITLKYGYVNISQEEQNEIDSLDNEIITKYKGLNEIYSSDILYDDLSNFYTSYGEMINSYEGLNTNLQEKLSNATERESWLNNMSDFISKISTFTTYIDDVKDLHPLSEIPECYQIMFDLESI